MHRLSYKLLLTASVLITLAGIFTLIPRAGASYPNILGYRSVCTFAPAATLFCFFTAGTICFFRAAFIKDQSGTAAERFRRHQKFLLLPGIVIAAAIITASYFADIKSEYTDGTTSATVMESTDEPERTD